MRPSHERHFLYACFPRELYLFPPHVIEHEQIGFNICWSTSAAAAAFVFIDGLTDVTKTLKKLKKNEIDSVLHNWNSYVKGDGHSDYEASFQELIDENKKLNKALWNEVNDFLLSA